LRLLTSKQNPLLAIFVMNTENPKIELEHRIDFLE